MIDEGKVIVELIDVFNELGVQLLNKRKVYSNKGEWVGTQFKSDADMYADEFITRNLKKITPSVPILSEEHIDLSNKARPKEYWLIDPIDGTASYVEGFDSFVTQAAYMRNKDVVLSVIYAPATNELYSAISGQGAYKNNNLIKTKNNKEIVFIDNYPKPKGITRTIMSNMPGSIYMESGSLSLKMMRVIEGVADIFIKDVEVKDWDFAPAVLFLNELGGRLSQYNFETFDLTGPWKKHGVIVARNDLLFEKIQQIIRLNINKN